MKETEKALLTIMETGNKVMNALADDGKIDFTEAMGISLKAIGIIGILKSLPKIKEELKVITPEDIASLVEIFKSKFDLVNDEAELKVEKGIEVLVQLIAMLLKPTN